MPDIRSTSRATLICAACLLVAPMALAQSRASLDRSVLPIQPPPAPAITAEDARGAPLPGVFSVTAPEGAPEGWRFRLQVEVVLQR